MCMQPGDADILTFAPVVTLRATGHAGSPRGNDLVATPKPNGKVEFAILGLSNMLNSGGSMNRMQRNASSNEGRFFKRTLLLLFHYSCSQR